RTALYDAQYDARLVSRFSDAPAELARIVGKHCESGDIVVRDTWVPGDIQPAVLLGVAATGSYCYSLSSRYNMIGRPAVVAVRAGRARLILRRETVDDLLSLEVRGSVSSDERPVGVAVLGLGNVGSEVVRIIEESADDLAARIGAPLVLRGIGVRRVAADRGVPVELLTDNVEELVSREDVDIVVEVMGPVEPSRKAILSALEHGKSVVTANKALLSVSTGELAQAAESASVDLYFEAAVAGAIPVIRPLTQSLAGDTVQRVAGIVNGTTNYILSEMDSTGADYKSALADASALGYAEADPTADVEGFAAAAKAPILASIAFHTRVTADDVYREGITKISPDDFVSARALGCTIKLLSICERVTADDGQQRVSARVYPALVPLEHPLATVNGAFNALVVEAEAAGRLMFYGQGAGGAPTASAE